ncbi:MAG: transposase, partial [Verrucomicrobia bacterium]|nr:transposase [Verrucomicrobiota bacterium]
MHFLPPYSPQLNPIERVWKLTRRTCLHNQYFSKLELVLNAVEEQFA